MSQWSGPISGQNSTGQTIYNVKISQTAPGRPAQTITATHVSNGNLFGSAQWQIAGTANDDWSWAYNLGTSTGPLITGSMECNLAQPGGGSVIILTRPARSSNRAVRASAPARTSDFTPRHLLEPLTRHGKGGAG